MDTNHIEVLQRIHDGYFPHGAERRAALDAAITALSARASAGEGGEETVECMARGMFYFDWANATESERNYWRGKARLALHAAPQPAQAGASGGGDAVACETCGGVGWIDETLGGYSFSNPKAPCPDCDGRGEITHAHDDGELSEVIGDLRKLAKEDGWIVCDVAADMLERQTPPAHGDGEGAISGIARIFIAEHDKAKADCIPKIFAKDQRKERDVIVALRAVMEQLRPLVNADISYSGDGLLAVVEENHPHQIICYWPVKAAEVLTTRPTPEAQEARDASDARRYRLLRGPYDSFKPYIRRDISGPIAGFEILLGANADAAIDALALPAQGEG